MNKIQILELALARKNAQNEFECFMRTEFYRFFEEVTMFNSFQIDNIVDENDNEVDLTNDSSDNLSLPIVHLLLPNRLKHHQN